MAISYLDEHEYAERIKGILRKLAKFAYMSDDLRDKQQYIHTIEETIQYFEKLDVLCNHVGESNFNN